MSIVSIVSCVVGTETNQEFIVDNTAIDVPITSGGGGTGIFSYFQVGVPKNFAIIGENFNILEVGIMCPHAFVLSKPIVASIIANRDPVGGGNVVYDSLTIANVNIPVAINKRINLEPIQALGTPPVYAHSTIQIAFDIPGRVSMLNVPDAINTQTIQLVPFMTIEHNFPWEA